MKKSEKKTSIQQIYPDLKRRKKGIYSYQKLTVFCFDDVWRVRDEHKNLLICSDYTLKSLLNRIENWKKQPESRQTRLEKSIYMEAPAHCRAK